MKYSIFAKCEDCDIEFEINKYTYDKNIKSNKKILCSKCRHSGKNNSNYGNFKKEKKRDKIFLTCEECNIEFSITREIAEKRKEKYGLNLCKSCSRKGDRNSFYGHTFTEKQIQNFSEIRKNYYEDEEFGQQRRNKQSKRFSGKNNPMYKGADLISDYTWRNKTYRNKILQRDNYICQKCLKSYNNDELRVHHKNSCDWNIKGRNDLNNGITLCIECHKRFHNIFGYGNNTENQFELFLNLCSETIETNLEE